MASSSDAELSPEYFVLLDSNELSTANEVKDLIFEHLKGASKDNWIITSLVEYYCQSQSTRCLDILLSIREPLDKVLMDKIYDQLRGTNRLQAIILLGHMIRVQMPVLHRLSNHPCMNYVIKLFRAETDVPVLMSSLLFIVCYLPFEPASNVQHLSDIYEGLYRLASYDLDKPVDVPLIYMHHLRAGMYCLFMRLYGMYPCHTMTFLRTTFQRQDRRKVFDHSIRPFLERCRMHPNLIMSSKDKEISKERWTQKEVHDILVESAKFCLDPIEGSTEDIQFPFFNASTQETTSSPQAALKYIFPGIDEDIVNMSLDSLLYKYQSNPAYGACSQGFNTPPGHQTTSSRGSSIHTPNKLSTMTTEVYDTENKMRAKRPVGMTLSMGSIGPNLPTPTAQQPCSMPPSPALRRYELSPPPLTADSVKNFKPDWPIPQPLSMQSLPKDEPSSSRSSTGYKLEQAKSAEIGVTPSVLTTALKEYKLSAEHKHSEELYSRSTNKEAGDRGPDNLSVSQRSENKGPDHLSASQRSENSGPDNLSTSQRSENRSEAKIGGGGGESEIRDALNPPSVVRDTSLNNSEMSSMSGTERADGEARTKHRTAEKYEAKKSSPISITRKQETEDQAKSLPNMGIQLLDLAGDIDLEDIGGSESSSGGGTGLSHIPPDVKLTAASIQDFMKKMQRIRFTSMTVTTLDRMAPRVTDAPRRTLSCPDVAQEEDVADDEWNIEIPVSSTRSKRKDSVSSKGSVRFAEESTVISVPVSNSAVITMVTPTNTISSQTSFFAVPWLHTPSTQVPVESFEVVLPPVPYSHILAQAIPFAPFLQCDTCRSREMQDVAAEEAGEVVTRVNFDLSRESTPERAVQTLANCFEGDLVFFAAPSPAQLLNNDILQSVAKHSYYEQAPRPTSSPYKGSGHPSVQELQGQIQLWQAQVLYERVKKDLLAQRNRRLHAQLIKATAVEEQLKALQSVVYLQESEIHDMTQTVQQLEGQLTASQLRKQQLEQEKILIQSKQEQEKESLKNRNKELEKELGHQKTLNKTLHEEVVKCKADLLSAQQQSVSLSGQAQIAIELQKQVEHLRSELVLMGELQQKYQQRLAEASVPPTVQLNLQLEVYVNQLNAMKQKLDQANFNHDVTKDKLRHAENEIKNQEARITKVLKDVDHVKKNHKFKVEALEDSLKTQRNIQESLEGQILVLTAQLHSHVCPSNISDIRHTHSLPATPLVQTDEQQTAPPLSAHGNLERPRTN